MTLVLLDGIDGSGKTGLADRLARLLRAEEVRLTLLHVDDYRRTVNWSDPRGEREVYWEDYFDLGALDEEISQHQAAGHLVLVEGIFTRRLAAADQGALIYLEVDFEEARRRIEARDTGKGRSLEEVRHRIDNRYFPAQHRYRAEHQPLRYAAAVLDTTNPAHPRLLRMERSRFPMAVAVSLCRLTD
jgi:uridine kinase